MATFTAASAKIKLVPSLEGFHRRASSDLRKMKLTASVDLVPDVAAFKSRVEAVKVTVPVKLSVSAAQFREQVKNLNVTVPTKLQVDAAHFRAQVEHLRVTIPTSLDVDTAAVHAALATLPSGTIHTSLQVDASSAMTSVRAAHAQMQAWLNGNPLTVRVHTDNSTLQQLIGHLNQVSSASNRASSSANGTSSALGRIGGAAGSVAKISGLIVGIGGAAGLAGGAVGGLAMGLAGLAAAGLPAIGAITVGLKGIGEAFKAFGKDAGGGAAAAVDNSSAIASAEHSVQTAMRGSKQAQEDLTRARKDARREIDDMNMSLRQSALDEREAAIAVADARDELAKTKNDSKATKRDREKAQLSLDQAVLRQEEAVKRGKRLAADTAEANKKGVEGSDQVVKAKQAIADADYQVVEAQRALADAMKSTASAAGGKDPVAEALAKLSPNARAFVETVHGMSDAWTEVKFATQDALFEGAAESIQGLATTYLPVLKTGLTGIATEMNGVAHGMAGLLQQPANVDKVGLAFSATAGVIAGAKSGILDMTQGVLDLGAAAAPVATQLGEGFGAIFGEIGKAFTELSNSGAMTQLFQNFGVLLESGIGPLLGDVVRTLTTLGNAVLPALTPLLSTLGNTLVMIAPQLGQLGAAFAQALTPILPVLGQVISALATALIPILPPLSQGIQTIGRVLAQILPIVAPVFEGIAENLSKALSALAPLLPPLFELVSAILTPMIAIAGQLFDAFAPLIAQLAEALRPVIEALTPILAEVGQILGEALTQAIQQMTPLMMPMVDAFMQLLQAILPILPVLVELAVKLLPVMMVQFQLWAPILTELIKLMASWIENQLKVLIPIISKVSEWVGKLTDKLQYLGPMMSMAIQMIKDGVGRAKDWIVEKFTAVVDFVRGLPQKVRDAASGLWDGIKDGFKSAVNWVVRKWNDLSFKIPEITIPNPLPGDNDFKIGGQSLDTPDIPYLASGGPVRGAGGPTDDKIPSMLSNGEFVMKTAAVRKYGLDFMNQVNSGLFKPQVAAAFASGGAVGTPTSAPAAPSGDPFAQMVALLSTIAGNTGQQAAATGGPGAAAPAGGGVTGAGAGVAGAAVGALGETVMTATGLIGPALLGVESQLTSLALTATTQLGTIAGPAMSALGSTISAVQAGTISPSLAAVNASLTQTGSAFVSAVTGTINPQWAAAGANIRAVQAGPMNTAFAEARNALWQTAQTFGPAVGMIGQQWSGIREATATPVRFTITSVFNDGVVGMWNSVSDLLGTTRMNQYPVRFATGGYVDPSLPGAKAGKDSIPALLMPGEFVMRKKVVDRFGESNLAKINGGMDPQGLFPASWRLSDVPQRLAAGGVVKGTPAWAALKRGWDWARSRSGRPYVLGGSADGAGGTDCSGYMSGIADVIQGGNGARQWATMAFNGGGNGQQASGPQGFIRGLAAGFSVGVLNGGPAGGHTAGTIGGVEGIPAVNVESGGSHGNVAFGGPAVGADHSQFPTRYHLPVVNGAFVSGGGGGRSLSDIVSSITGPAWQRITATAAGYRGAGGTIDEYPSKVAARLKDSTSKKIDKLIQETTSFADPGGAGVERWRPLVRLLLMRYRLGEDNADRTLRRMNQESGGNPRAINNYDINAKNGTPSKGLMQVIQPTFDAFRDPALSPDIWDPMANVASSMRYAMSRYGSLASAYDRAGGYDQGGWMDPGVNAFYNGFRKPEAVLTPSESEAFVGIAQRWVEDERAGSTYVGQQVQNQWLVDPDAQSASTRRSVRRAIRQEVALV
ncbi:Phage-related protein [Gordonia malaquae]|uniref:Transglycosylase SLT domain-containing protein n=1 Tax=Gordonia malaquae NBRC 108250 TaxID=1223542 RepID=M3TI90_GORML|nr:transglycosylase SLT domain-containing protein [Gordonia malaquae]GAC81221.1 hypothetical protein GM1_030_00500 [Gordonia malaquae NBRC 108250]SEE23709.1 Phage-related protein [Gordonia malaquae]